MRCSLLSSSLASWFAAGLCAQAAAQQDLFAPDRVMTVEITMDKRDWNRLRMQTRDLKEALSAKRKAGEFDSPFTWFDADVVVDEVAFDGVEVGADRLLGGADLLDRVIDQATVGLAAEMLGTAEEAFERTLQYLKDREQFGARIGTFQALRHRAAEMFSELEFARSIVRDALSAVDEGREDAAACVSAESG